LLLLIYYTQGLMEHKGKQHGIFRRRILAEVFSMWLWEFPREVWVAERSHAREPFLRKVSYLALAASFTRVSVKTVGFCGSPPL